MTVTEKTQQLPVLVIDDDQSGSEALCGHLLFRGYRAKAIQSGADALSYLTGMKPEERPCVILLDVLMPGMNGCEVLSEIRSHPATRDIPVIMLSVLNREEIQEQLSCPCTGANAYVSKPFDIEKLISQLERIVHA